MKLFFLCLMAGFWVAGCQTVAPLDKSTVFFDRETFMEKFQQDTGASDEPILQYGRCNLHLATPGATITTNFRFCTYALTEKRLLVQEWDAANMKYTHFMSVDFERLSSVDWISYWEVKQVKLLEPQRLTGISAVIDDGGDIDAKATEMIFQTVQELGIPSSEDNKLLTLPLPRPEPVVAPMIIYRFDGYHGHYRRGHRRR